MMYNDATGKGGAIYNAGILNTAGSGFVSPYYGMMLHGNYAGTDGGGFYNASKAQATLSDSFFMKNYAGNNGGGIANAGTLNVSGTGYYGSIFAANYAKHNGGGIYNKQGGQTTLGNGTMVYNIGYSGGHIFNDGQFTTSGTLIGYYFLPSMAVYGGAVYNGTNGTLNITNGTTITGGYAHKAGGGIYNKGTMTVADSTVTYNYAYSASGGGTYIGYGGGIFNKGTATVSNSTITYNYAYNGGGGIHNATGADLTVDNSTISKNHSGYGGGTLQPWHGNGSEQHSDQ